MSKPTQQDLKAEIARLNEEKDALDLAVKQQDALDPCETASRGRFCCD